MPEHTLSQVLPLCLWKHPKTSKTTASPWPCPFLGAAESQKLSAHVKVQPVTITAPSPQTDAPPHHSKPAKRLPVSYHCNKADEGCGWGSTDLRLGCC